MIIIIIIENKCSANEIDYSIIHIQCHLPIKISPSDSMPRLLSSHWLNSVPANRTHLTVCY